MLHQINAGANDKEKQKVLELDIVLKPDMIGVIITW